MCRRYVGGLAAGVVEGDLRDQFYPFGEIRSIRVRLWFACVPVGPVRFRLIQASQFSPFASCMT